MIEAETETIQRLFDTIISFTSRKSHVNDFASVLKKNVPLRGIIFSKKSVKISSH